MSDETPTIQHDPLDIAFIAMGAAQAQLCLSSWHRGTDRFEGQIGYIQKCIDHAELLHRVWLEQKDGYPGVWAYEVAEQFGYLYGTHILEGGDVNDAEKLLRAIVAKKIESGLTFLR